MVVDCVDGRDEVVGSVMRKDIFKGECGYRTVHVFVFNSQGHLLLQQQSRNRERAPLSWGSSVAAYLFAGESYEAAATRRLIQELDVRPKGVELIGVVRMDDLGHDKFVGLVTAESDGPFKIDRAHIRQVQFMPIPRVLARWKRGSITLTPTFIALLQFYTRARGSDSNSRRAT